MFSYAACGEGHKACARTSCNNNRFCCGHLRGAVCVYYDRLMPCLKYIIQNANTEELKMLRGKAIECVSLIGLAVGAEKVSLLWADLKTGQY